MVGPKALNEDCGRSLPDKGPVVMVNPVRFRKRSLDGKRSGWDAYSRYSKGDMPLLRKVGGTFIWAGNVEGVSVGDLGDGGCDCVVLAPYPSRAVFLEMMTSPEYEAINVDRENGVEDHVILVANQTYPKLASTPAAL